MTTPRLLLVEDDPDLAGLLTELLTSEGYDVDTAGDGQRGLHLGLTRDYDLMLLDRGLPAIEGLDLLTRLRSRGRSTPTLVLSALGNPRDRVEGLDAGAEDYLGKPFDLDELLARLRALHRRGGTVSEAVVQVGDLVVDPAARRVTRGGVEIELSAREFDILHLLATHAGRVVTRLTILDEVWDGETDLRSNVIDVHLASIRAKIDRAFGTETITTVRGVGYRVDPPDRPA